MSTRRRSRRKGGERGEAPAVPSPGRVASVVSLASRDAPAAPVALAPAGASAPPREGPGGGSGPVDTWGSRLRWGGVVLLVVGGLLYLTWSVLSVLVAAAVLAYLLDRPVTWLAARGMSRDMAIAVLALASVGVVVVAGLVVVPLVVHQIGELATNFVPYVDNLVAQIGPWRADIEARLGVALPVDLTSLSDVAPEYLRRLSSLPNAGQVAKDAVAWIAGGGAQVVVTVLTLALLPVFTFYAARDWPTFVAAADGLIPPRHRPEVRRIAGEIDLRTMAFVKGQALLCLILGALYSGGLLVAGIDLAVVVGMTSGLLFVVPYVGTIAGCGLAVILALLKFGFDWHVAVCVATYVVVQLVEGSLLTPVIVGDRVGLHPMVVMIGVVVFGNLLGVWGLVVAVPLTAALSVLAGALLDAWRASRTFQG